MDTAYREEVDVMGADGHIYRGRMERLEAKMPMRMARSASTNRQSNSEVSELLGSVVCFGSLAHHVAGQHVGEGEVSKLYPKIVLTGLNAPLLIPTGNISCMGQATKAFSCIPLPPPFSPTFLR